MKAKFSKVIGKLFTTVMGALVGVSAVGCFGGGNAGQEIDENKIQLNVTYYNKGFGGEYVRELGGRFEDVYKDVQFGDKTGVQVMYYPTDDDSKFRDAGLFKGATNFDVALSENTLIRTLIKGDALLDVTDVLTETSKYDGKKIVDKMSAQQQAAVSKGGNMYAVPHYTSSYGIVYNMSLFNVNNWYFKDGYTLPSNYNPDDAIGDYNKYQATNINGMFISSSSDKKTAGPDGAYETEDDGLPCTYDEFFWLCKKITQKTGCTPISWAGKYYSYYLQDALKSFLADATGKEGYLNIFDPIGKTPQDLIEIDENGDIKSIAGTELTKEDCANIRKQKGLYDAVRFLNVLVNGSYHNEDAFSTSHEHTTNQYEFIDSYAAGGGYTGVAMIIDGAWWEREAINSNAFSEVEDSWGNEYSRENMNFGWMPLPKVSKTAYETSKQSYCADSLCSYIIARKIDKSDIKYELVKDFIRFACSDESLQQFTVVTGGLKGLNYEIDDAHMSQMSNFAKNYYKTMKNPNTKPEFLYAVSDGALYEANPSYFIKNMFNINPTTEVATQLHTLGADNFTYSDAREVFNSICSHAKGQMNNKV